MILREIQRENAKWDLSNVMAVPLFKFHFGFALAVCKQTKQPEAFKNAVYISSHLYQ